MSQGFYLGLFIVLSRLVFADDPDKSETEQDTIQWLNFDIAPGGISSGAFQYQGIGDQFYKAYKAALPEYTHRLTYANVARMRKVIESPKNTCIVYIFHLPEYSAYRHWGPINYIAPPNRIITTQQNADKFKKGVNSLAHLLKNSPLRLGVMGGRAYRVPGILGENSDNPKITKVYSSSKSIYRMLQLRRLDYTLGDWVELDFMEKTMDLEIPFIAYPMQEDTGYKANYVSCTGNAWGKVIVEKLHKHFNSPDVVKSELLPSILQWIRASDQQEYKKIISIK